MPISELNDYINLINNEQEEDVEWKTEQQQEEERPDFRSTFGNIKNPLK